MEIAVRKASDKIDSTYTLRFGILVDRGRVADRFEIGLPTSDENLARVIANGVLVALCKIGARPNPPIHITDDHGRVYTGADVEQMKNNIIDSIYGKKKRRRTLPADNRQGCSES